MVSHKVTITIEHGMHMFPAEVLAKVASVFNSRIELKRGNKTVNAKSMLSLLSSNVKFGEELQIVCDGEDEEDALKKIVHFFENSDEYLDKDKKEK